MTLPHVTQYARSVQRNGSRKKSPSEYGPRKRSESQAAAVLVRMSRAEKELLKQSADRLGISMNQVVLEELKQLFAWELLHIQVHKPQGADTPRNQTQRPPSKESESE